MPPRIPTLSALRQGMFSLSLKTSTAPLSTTAVCQALRKPSSALLEMDTASPSSPADPTALARDIYANMPGRRQNRGTPQSRRNIEQMMNQSHRQDDMMRQLPRRWRAGDVYAPHDMSPSEMAKWRKNTARQKDLVDLLGLRPLDMYRNFSVISEFMTPHGRIKRSVETGLNPANQRKMAKAIRRAIGLGLHPSVHHHPELLMRGPNRVLMQNIATQDRNLKWQS